MEDKQSKKPSALEQELMQEAADTKMRAAAEKAYNKASTVAPRPKTGTDAGEAGKPWNEMFPKK